MKKVKDRLHQSAEAGFTIIESLAAIVVVTILMVGITPMLGIAVATRVQARRVELGSQAARSYIDRLRSGAIDHPTVSDTDKPKDAAVPASGTLSCDNSDRSYCTVPANVYCVDGDGDGHCRTSSVLDMVVQGVGYNPSADAATNAENAQKGYLLGVRTYRADAFIDSTALQKGSQQATFTGGSGNRKAPVVEFVTEISTDDTTYEDYCDRLADASRTDACD